MSDMSRRSPLDVAIEVLGATKLAKELAITHQAVRKWQRARRMPRTEWTGETHYAEKIEELMAGAVTKAQLLDKWPEPDAADAPTDTEAA